MTTRDSREQLESAATQASQITDAPERAADAVPEEAQNAAHQASSAASTARNAASAAQQLPQESPQGIVQQASGMAGPATGAIASHVPEETGVVVGAVAAVTSAASAVAGVVGAVRSMASSALGALGGSPSPLPEVNYRFRAQGAEDWTPVVVQVTEALGEWYEAVIELSHDEAGALPGEMLGQTATFTIERDGYEHRWSGLVRRVEDLGTAGGHRLARVYLVPPLWALSQRVDTRIYQDKNVREVIAAVLREAGLPADGIDWQLRATYETREYCVQYNETDFHFIKRLMEEEGLTFYFRREDDNEKVVITDHPDITAIETMDGEALRVVGPEIRTLHVEAVRHFDWSREMAPTSVAVYDYNFTITDRGATQPAVTPRDAPGTRPQYHHAADAVFSRYDDTLYPRDNTSVQSQLRHDLNVAASQRAVGEGTVTRFKAGHLFALRGHGDSALDQRYVLTRVEHRGYAADELLHALERKRPDGVFRYQNRFEALPASVTYRPPRTLQRPMIAGLESARVVGCAEDTEHDVHTDRHGRIKVQFHWDRRHLDDHRASCWVRVMQTWAGSGYGFQFLPRVGMEVVVSFLGGNPDRPVVVGSVYNAPHAFPYIDQAAGPQHPTRSAIKTRSSDDNEGSNEIRFEDLAGQEEIFVHAQKDYNEVVENNHSTTVHANQTNTVDANQSESVGGNQTMTVTHDRTKTVEQKETNTINNERHTTVKPLDEHTVNGQHNQTVNGDQNLTVNAGQGGGTRTVYVDGRDTETFHGGHQVYVDQFDNTEVRAANKNTTVHGQYNIVADTHFKVQQGARDQLFISNRYYLESAGKLQMLNDGGSIEVETSGAVTVTAKAELVLKCGAASISLKSDGTIAISGAKEVGVGSGPSAVKVEPPGVNVSGPKINSAAIGMHEISGALIKIN